MTDRTDLKISVIICGYTMERLHDIREAVNSIRNQTLKPFEIIISVDHNTELYDILEADTSVEIKVVLNNGEKGLSETRNVGIIASRGDIVAFIDDDAIADNEWLQKLSEQYTNSRVIAVGGRAVPQWMEGYRPAYLPEELDWIIGCSHKGPTPATNEVRNMIGCNMSFRKEVFDKAGYFSSKVGRVGKLQGLGEEAEICLRIKHAQPEALILYEQNAIIYHKVPLWRVNYKYLIQRSYNEGLYKLIVKNMAPRETSISLSSERSYLKFLLFSAIPRRIAGFYRKGYILQCTSIMLCLLMVGIGYTKGIFTTRKMANAVKKAEIDTCQ